MEARFSPATFGRFLLDVLLRKRSKGEIEKVRVDTGKRIDGVSGLRRLTSPGAEEKQRRTGGAPASFLSGLAAQFRWGREGK